MFTEEELPRAFTIYSLSGALGASFGVQIGGLVELIPNGGQMSGWRWYFRITTAVMYVNYDPVKGMGGAVFADRRISIPVSLWSLKYVPSPQGEESDAKHKWKRLDLQGSVL